MKIKPPSARNRRLAALKARHPHWWLLDNKPKKIGRLSQRNKVNKKLKARFKSEFLQMAQALENKRNEK